MTTVKKLKEVVRFNDLLPSCSALELKLIEILPNYPCLRECDESSPPIQPDPILSYGSYFFHSYPINFIIIFLIIHLQPDPEFRYLPVERILASFSPSHRVHILTTPNGRFLVYGREPSAQQEHMRLFWIDLRYAFIRLVFQGRRHSLI